MESKRLFVSIVSPVYGCSTTIVELYNRILSALASITDSFEIIFVNDDSPDNSWEIISDICKRDKRAKGINLSRNFGQHCAVTAGLTAAKGEVNIILDCDLQDDPFYFDNLIKEYQSGYDVVFTKRIKRKHSLYKSITSKIYNLSFVIFSENKYSVDVGSLILFSDKVRDEFLKIKDKDRLYIQLIKWIGFKQSFIIVEHKERLSGKTSYSFVKLLKLALQGWTSHSYKLLKYSVYIGLIISLIAFLSVGLIVILYFINGFQSGWASLAVLNLFSTGLIMMSIGIVGVYIGKTFEQTKNKPLFIISEKLNIND